MWRTTPIHRWELEGSLEDDSPPAIDRGVEQHELQRPADGVGPLLHRVYRIRIRESKLSAEELIERIAADLDAMAPGELASFHRLRGAEGKLAVNDEYVVRMPGPWDGPVRVVAVGHASFRLATLAGHLEAGQIEFRARAARSSIEMVIESWARSSDRLVDLLYSHARMAKEIQFYMWTSVLVRIAALAGGTRDGGLVVTTRRVDDAERETGSGPWHSRAQRRVADLAGKALNFEPSQLGKGPGWHHDEQTQPLPSETPGEPDEGRSWQTARRLMVGYQMADPRRVRATYRPNSPLEGRDMLLTVRFAGLPIRAGVRIGDVYDETRTVDGARVRLFGWDYSTLEGHFEEGRINYELWKWTESGDVEFRLRAVSRPATRGPVWRRIGFRLIGRPLQLDFYRQTCRRMRRLTESELELARVEARR